MAIRLGRLDVGLRGVATWLGRLEVGLGIGFLGFNNVKSQVRLDWNVESGYPN